METFFPALIEPGRYSENSEIARKKNERKLHLTNQRKKWTDEHRDKFLELWLAAGCVYKSLCRDSLESCLGRSWRSVDSMKWKIPAKYKPHGKYRPHARTDRTGRPWTKADYQVIGIALGEKGVKYGGNDPSWIAKVLGRLEKEVVKEIRRLKKKPELLYDD